LPSKPKKIAIVGGGYIALEFAGIFNGLNCEVHVFIRQKKVLRGFDEDVSKKLRMTFAAFIYPSGYFLIVIVILVSGQGFRWRADVFKRY